MKPVHIHHGDSREVLKGIADNSIDSCCTDAPYVLTSILKRWGGYDAAPPKSGGKSGVYERVPAGFMGQRWDIGELVHDPAFWSEIYRVLKPGAFLLAFSGDRTQHRQTCAIEDAGFEIRASILDIVAGDTFLRRFMASLSEEQVRAFALAIEQSEFGGMLAWTFGAGFPKDHDLARQYEITLCERVERSGRKVWVYVDDKADMATEAPYRHHMANLWSGWGTALKPAFEPICVARKPLIGTVAANVEAFRTGALNIDGCRIGLGDDRARGGPPTKRGSQSIGGGWANDRERATGGRWPANVVHDGSDQVVSAFPEAPGQQRVVTGNEPTANGFSGAVSYSGMLGRVASAPPRGDEGSAARFFYSAKADADDRLGSKHPTVKPIDLMRWLCRLVTPPGGVVLDPFAGSGSTGVAAMLEGFESILIEREADYVADIRRKVDFYRGEGRLAIQEKGKVSASPVEDLPLFGGEAA